MNSSIKCYVMIFFGLNITKDSLTYLRVKETIWVNCYSHWRLVSLVKPKLIDQNL